MKTILGGVALTTLAAGMACAGGVERSSQSTGILFKEGTYAELTYGSVDPGVSGTQASSFLFFGSVGAGTGDVSPDYETVTLAFKTAITDKIDVAFIIDEPIGASVEYANPDYAYGVGDGSRATIESTALTALLRYKLPNNFSVFGGVRHQRVKGEVDLYIGYTMSIEQTADTGWVVGAAWEKPEIAARVSLTYNSAIKHDFNATEFGVFETEFSTTIPQSLNLEFQTGIAEDTLLFGSVRWVDWTAFEIRPEVYDNLLNAALVDYDDDTITYSLGVGRRFTDQFSGAVTVSHEPSSGGFSGNLGPTDGFTSLGLAASYKVNDNLTLTGGVRHIWIGDAKTQNPISEGTTLGDFDGNTGFAWGLQIGYQF